MRPYKTGQGNWQLNFTLDGVQRTLYLGRKFSVSGADKVAKVVSELLQYHFNREVVPAEFLRRAAALRIGDWKVLYIKTGEEPLKVPAAKSTVSAGWSLYNLSVDRSEQNDLSAKEPERTASMVQHWRELNRQFRQEAE